MVRGLSYHYLTIRGLLQTYYLALFERKKAILDEWLCYVARYVANCNIVNALCYGLQHSECLMLRFNF